MLLIVQYSIQKKKTRKSKSSWGEIHFLVTSFLHISYNMFGQHRRFRHLLQLKPTQIYHIQMSQDPVCELFVCFCSILDLELQRTICIFSPT